MCYGQHDDGGAISFPVDVHIVGGKAVSNWGFILETSSLV